METISPRPDEQDVTVSVHFGAPPVVHAWRACRSAAERFARTWRRAALPGSVTIDDDPAHLPSAGRRMPCEVLWCQP